MTAPRLAALWLVAVLATGCAGESASPAAQRPRAIATINILADFARGVAGDRIEVSSLIPVGGDPHTYEPVPRDVQRIAESHILFYNGLGLEKWLHKLIANAGGRRVMVEVTRGLRPAIQTSGAYAGDPDP
ncbi:MAG: zinc ABC transporter substrate-binding protein, partial [Armatimonadota bacterium]|nr:zinc ABC transporter substrate-binding protein [Armatimonadota bacterium]